MTTDSPNPYPPLEWHVIPERRRLTPRAPRVPVRPPTGKRIRLTQLKAALLLELAHGPRPVTDLTAMLGHGPASLKAARAELGVLTIRRDGRWQWTLPDESTSEGRA